MELWKIEPGKPLAAMAAGEQLPEKGFVWLDLVYDEIDSLAERIEALTGVRVYDEHVEDARFLGHPSTFDGTDQYEVIVFRGLAPFEANEPITTRPTTYFNFDRLLVTVRAPDSRSVAQVKNRLLAVPAKAPQSPDDLMHRLLSAMVDHYLDLRQPLTQRLDRWQRALLDPRKPFSDWMRLLEGRNDLRRLQNLCEEQRDAVQEWRDFRLPEIDERLQIRFADLVEHIDRVQAHARYTEQQAESAVQLYFAANAHRTAEIMRLLTLITAVFMPLTLIAGIFGMNFEAIPGLHSRYGFWISLGSMAVIVVALLAYFRWRRWF